MAQLTLNTSISINASKEEVWEGLTNPTLIKQYFFGTDAKSDWKTGSPVTFSGEWEGKTYEDKGTILESEKNRLLKYSYWSSFSGKPDSPENYANVAYELTESNNATTLTITQDNIDSEAAKKHSEGNWQLVMGNLKKLLEKK